MRMYEISCHKSFSLREMKLTTSNKFRHVELSVKGRSANNTGTEEKVSCCQVVLNVLTKGLSL